MCDMIKATERSENTMQFDNINSFGKAMDG